MMEIELIRNKRNFYEIWADKACILEIAPLKSETPDAYKRRSEGEYDKYVEKLKSLKNGSSNKSIKKTTI